MTTDGEFTDETTNEPAPGFAPLEEGTRVYVDEGDSFGCQEYTGVFETLTEDGRLQVRLDDGSVRYALRHQVDPA